MRPHAERDPETYTQPARTDTDSDSAWQLVEKDRPRFWYLRSRGEVEAWSRACATQRRVSLQENRGSVSCVRERSFAAQRLNWMDGCCARSWDQSVIR